MQRFDDEVSEPFTERRTSDNTRRRSGKRCPVCLTALGKNKRRTKQLGFCKQCQAHPTQKRCRGCAQPMVWENKHGAACQGCALVGTKSAVIQGPPA